MRSSYDTQHIEIDQIVLINRSKH